MGATVAFPIDRHNSVKVYASTDATARTGTDFTTVGFAWQFRWGGGCKGSPPLMGDQP